MIVMSTKIRNQNEGADIFLKEPNGSSMVKKHNNLNEKFTKWVQQQTWKGRKINQRNLKIKL